MLFEIMSIFQRIVYWEYIHLDVQASVTEDHPEHHWSSSLRQACIPAQKGVSLPDSHKSTMWATDGPHHMKIESNSFLPKDCFRYYWLSPVGSPNFIIPSNILLTISCTHQESIYILNRVFTLYYLFSLFICDHACI